LASVETVGKVLRRFSRPIFIAGSLLAEDNSVSPYLVEFALKIGKTGIPVVATAHTEKVFRDHGFTSVASMGILEIIERLSDPSWKGLDGKGNYDLAIFLGFPYFLASQALSALKHFAPHIKTVSTDQWYHPSATWSFPNLMKKDWLKNLEKLANFLAGEHVEQTARRLSS
jgi:acetyl-CoA decarbonylase/synthase complex subunit epsilon